MGSLKPNDLGLFDVHGNVWNWCQEKYTPYLQTKEGAAKEDNEDMLSVNNQDGRSLRGGAFNNLMSNVRCAYRSWSVPASRNNLVGFRAARTLPLGTSTTLPFSNSAAGAAGRRQK